MSAIQKITSWFLYHNRPISLGHLRLLLFISYLTSISFVVNGQVNAEFIYGVITVESGDSYEGFMRWGKEELSWHDTFNSSKTGARIKKSSGENAAKWGDFDWSIGSLWKDKYRGSNRSFACLFGDIAVIHVKSRGRVDLELKNGAIIKVDGGSNDVGATINMRDYELGTIKLSWKNIKTIEFFQAPLGRNSNYGKILFGTATTRKGQEFKGYIKWDDDERIGQDVLDGDSRNGEQKIPFENVMSIQKSGDGSDLIFKSGRSLFLDGSNDVSNGNRGIVVFQKDIGTTNIPWKSFDKLVLEDPPTGLTYNNYANPKALEGKVVTYRNEVFEGQLIFDLDEIWDMEILDGEDDDIDYQIPFRNIKRIIPKNRSYSMIYLRNGQELLLGDSQDVSNRNDGVLIVNDQKDRPISVDWDDIDEIIFND